MENDEFSEITLRPMEVSDLDDFMLWATDDKVSRYCVWDTYTSKEQGLDYIKNNAIPHPFHRVICIKNRAIGAISVTPSSGNDQCRGELGYVLAYKYWGKGIVCRAVEMVLDTIFDEWKHLERLQALVDVGNKASQRVLEKVGFLKEGINGQINSPCTASMLTSFNPCMSFLTIASNITQPPPGCCNAISSLMSNGSGCFCQIATGNIFFRIPINRTLAFSLPRACNMPNVTLDCNSSGSGSPAPAPGPAGGLANAPGESPSLSTPVPASAPGVDSTTTIPPSIASQGPIPDTDSPPPSPTPSSSTASFIGVSPLLIVVAMLGAIVHR
ncbi:acyltransferase [Lithospermum erythrorhizon]|uniref:Acyltransferase n=1 Tax=Lithospermum erythrorhizon TaxID=34254 RepID=A0AAV3NUT0_LITER